MDILSQSMFLYKPRMFLKKPIILMGIIHIIHGIHNLKERPEWGFHGLFGVKKV